MGLNNPIPRSLSSESSKAAKVLQSFVKPNQVFGQDQVIPPRVLKEAKGLAVITVLKAGFLFSGRAGSGVIVARLPDGSWSPPSGIAMAGAGAGGLVGVELTDFVFILNTEDAVKSFSEFGTLTLGGNMAVSAGPIGRNAEYDASASMGGIASVFSYSKSKGLFAGVSVEGSMIVERREENRKFYGENCTAKMILSGKVRPPPGAARLYKVLDSRAFNYDGSYDGDSLYDDIPDNLSDVSSFRYGDDDDDYSRRGDRPSRGRYSEYDDYDNSKGKFYSGHNRSDDYKDSERDRRGDGYYRDDRDRRGYNERRPGRYDDDDDRYGRKDPYSRDRRANDRYDNSRDSPRSRGQYSSRNTGYDRDYNSPRYDGRDRDYRASDRGYDERRGDYRSPDRGYDERRGDYRSPERGYNDKDYGQSPRRNDERGYGQSPRRDESRDNNYVNKLSNSLNQTLISPPRGGTNVRASPISPGGIPVPPKPRGLSGGPKAVALFDFAGVENGDLSFKKGDVITVIKKTASQNDWWTGRTNGKEGLFPANYVEIA